MRYFKFPLIVTAIAFGVLLVFAIIGMVVIDRTARNDQEKLARGKLLGQGLGTLTCFVIAPFWLIAAAKLGKERREALAKKNAQASKKTGKKKGSE